MLGLVKTKRSGNVLGQDVTVKLSDRAGVGRFKIVDIDGAIVFSVDSLGNKRQRGQDLRVT